VDCAGVGCCTTFHKGNAISLHVDNYRSVYLISQVFPSATIDEVSFSLSVNGEARVIGRLRGGSNTEISV